MGKRRYRKASLRGWWRSLPFLLSAFGLLFTCAMLEARLLNNEYRSNALTTEIWEVRAEMKKLRDRRHYLNRMERMDSQAPALSLVPADPEQIVPIEIEAEDDRTARRVKRPARTPSRSVVMRLVAPPRERLPRAPSVEREIASADNHPAPSG